ncbi:branched-chain amino acid ABC transporter permease [Candidatus Woesearchaeota archaeon]|nr:branched-chain amino acid ABC transporter permease [Candidatus Woesearchaeota archaeon]
MIHEYLISILTFISIYSIIVLSLNVVIGFTGLINLGHIVFVGIGAYASAILALNGVPWYISIFAAGILASVFGAAIAAITSRLKGDYLAMVTLGLVFIAVAVSRNWISLTRGALGLPGIPDIIKNNFHYMIFTMAISALSVFLFYRLTNSETGKIFQAIRDNEVAASVLGKNTYFYKIISMAASTFFAGIAGSLLAHHLNFVDPTIFELDFIVTMLVMLIAGGLASITGSVVGVFILYALSESIRFIVVNPSIVGAFREMVFAVVLILILIFRPRGMFGKVDI